MKRFFAVVTILLLTLALLPSAVAEGPVAFYVDAPSEAKAGDTLTVRVSLTGEYEAHILNMRLNYDPKSLEYVSVTRGEVLQAAAMGMAICEKAEDKPFISVGILMYGDPIHAEGVIFEAVFTVLSGASSSTKLELEVTEFGYLPITATVAQPVENTVENATVKISGGSGGAQLTPEATVRPISGPTESAVTTPAPTEAGSEDATPAATEGADPTPAATSLPVLDTDNAHTYSFEPGDFSGVTKNPEVPGGDDNGGSRLSGPVKGVVIGLGSLLAVGLGWLTVHFFKKGREEGRKARGK